MTFNVPSFFAGIATVVALLIFGFGGGVFMSSVILDQGARTPTKTERQVSKQTPPADPQKQPTPASAPAAQLLPSAEQPSDAPPAAPPPKLQNILASPASASAAPAGPQKPVSLVNPAQEAIASRNETRRKKEDARRAAQERKDAKRRKLTEQRRQQITEAELKATSISRSNAGDVDSEEPDERPLLRPERDDSFRAPRLRIGNEW